MCRCAVCKTVNWFDFIHQYQFDLLLFVSIGEKFSPVVSKRIQESLLKDNDAARIWSLLDTREPERIVLELFLRKAYLHRKSITCAEREASRLFKQIYGDQVTTIKSRLLLLKRAKLRSRNWATELEKHKTSKHYEKLLSPSPPIVGFSTNILKG